MADWIAAMLSKPTIEDLARAAGRLDRGQGTQGHAVVAAQDRLVLGVLAEHRRGDSIGLVHLPLAVCESTILMPADCHRVLEAQPALLAVERGSDALEHDHLVAGFQPLGQELADLASPARLSGPTNGILIPWSAIT